MDKMGNYLVQQLGYEQNYQCNYFGPFSLGLHYYYYLNQQWAIGIKYAYAHGETPYFNWNEKGITGNCNVLMRSHLMMAALKWQWQEYLSFHFYSKVATGIQRRHVYCSFQDNKPHSDAPDDMKWLPAYQISPLCMEVGWKGVRFFLELGYGNEGVLSMGVSTKI
jgi:hypothetical protein